MRAFDGQWSAWTVATPTDTGAVMANSPSPVGYTGTLAPSSIFNVSGSPITGYNDYLDGPHDDVVPAATIQ